MRRVIWPLVIGLVLVSTSHAESASDKTHLFMPDGQLKSHSVRVYVAQDITAKQQPTLRLLRSHAVTKQAADETARLEPRIVAPGQEWLEQVGGQEVRRTGTLLLFDLGGLNFGFKAMMRVMPVVTWTEEGSERIVVAPGGVNLGNIVGAIGWAALVVMAAIVLVVWLARRANRTPLQFLCGVDGHLSLAQTQVACWTVAVGGVVLGYGMVRLEVPTIPTSLLALMGASLVTGGVGYFQDAQKQQAAVAAGTATTRSPALADLLLGFTPGQAQELSLAKAQMLFWTLLLLVLFLAKSILDGVIWEVPWPLVALMGFSQAGYLAPKLVP
jgi:hypothetical protein